MKKKVTLTLFMVVYSICAIAQKLFTQRVVLVAHPILELKVDNGFESVNFTLESESDYKLGKKMTQALILQVKSNNNWVVNVRANSDNFIPQSLNGLPVKSNVLSLGQTGFENLIAVNSSEQPLVHGSYGGFDVNRFSFDYNLDPGFIKPDVYELGLIFTLTTP